MAINITAFGTITHSIVGLTETFSKKALNKMFHLDFYIKVQTIFKLFGAITFCRCHYTHHNDIWLNDTHSFII